AVSALKGVAAVSTQLRLFGRSASSDSRARAYSLAAPGLLASMRANTSSPGEKALPGGAVTTVPARSWPGTGSLSAGTVEGKSRAHQSSPRQGAVAATFTRTSL